MNFDKKVSLLQFFKNDMVVIINEWYGECHNGILPRIVKAISLEDLINKLKYQIFQS